MKPFACLILAASILLACGTVRGQGLLAIGQGADYSSNIPLTFDTKLSTGYDDIRYAVPSAGQPDLSSAFVEGAVGLTYSDVSTPTKWVLGGEFGLLHYFDNQSGIKDLYSNSRVSVNFVHEFDRRLKISDNLFVAYEVEPDYGVGVSVGSFAGQYLYGYNNLNLAYAWTERFSTTTSYTIDGIHYTDDPSISDIEDHLEHIISQQFAYQLSRTTTLTAEYRFGLVRYSSAVVNASTTNPDYMSHYVLLGIDQAWSPQLNGSLRAGAQFYESGRDHQIAPYAEASLDYKLTRKTKLRWYAQSGYNPTELGDYASNYTIQTGITGTYQVSQAFSLNAGIHYLHSDYTGTVGLPGFTDNELDLTAGFTYSLWKNLALDANYSYTTIGSELATQVYDRNRVNLGLNASF